MTNVFLIPTILFVCSYLKPSTAYEVSAYCGGDWLSSCSLVPDDWNVLDGAFQPDINTKPLPVPSSHPNGNYLALGGYRVGGNVPSAESIVHMMEQAKCGNVDFDLEGVLEQKYSLVSNLAEGIRPHLPEAHFQVTCLSGDDTGIAPYTDSFDTIGIMIYADEMQSGGWSIPKDNPQSGTTWPVIQRWLSNSGIPNNKIMLGMTTSGLEPYMVDWYKQLVAEYGLKGIFLWKIKDLAGTGVSIECIQDPNVSCDGGTPSPTPTPPLVPVTSNIPCDGSPFTVQPGASCWNYWQDCAADFVLCCEQAGQTCVKDDTSLQFLYAGDTCHVSYSTNCSTRALSAIPPGEGVVGSLQGSAVHQNGLLGEGVVGSLQGSAVHQNGLRGAKQRKHD